MSVLAPARDGRVAWSTPPSLEIAALLEVDPDLGQSLGPDRLGAARRELRVRIVGLERGPWRLDRLGRVHAAHLGLLVIDGLVGREMLAHDTASMELLGPGDVLRPSAESADSELLQARVRWSTLSPARVALLEGQLVDRLAAYPEVYCAVLERWACRTRRLAVLQTISQLNRVDRRVLTLLWHLAERWGRVTPDGVLVPLALSHRMLGQLVGARRPTVSTALAELTRVGEVTRGQHGTWILTGAPVGAPDARTSRFIVPRRAMRAPRGDEIAL